jgi:hypothetical protein
VIVLVVVEMYSYPGAGKGEGEGGGFGGRRTSKLGGRNIYCNKYLLTCFVGFVNRDIFVDSSKARRNISE